MTLLGCIVLARISFNVVDVCSFFNYIPLKTNIQTKLKLDPMPMSIRIITTSSTSQENIVSMLVGIITTSSAYLENTDIRVNKLCHTYTYIQQYLLEKREFNEFIY